MDVKSGLLTFNDGKSSFVASLFNLTNTIIGAGILALPFAFKSSGLILGILLTVFVWALSLSSAFLLIRSSSLAKQLSRSGKSRARSYRQLVSLSFGRYGSLFVECCILMFQLGACVAYIVIIGETVSPYLRIWTGSSSVFTQDWLVQLVALVLVLWPLSLLPNLNSLRFTSGLALVGIAFLVVCVLVRFSGNLSQAVADEDDLFLKTQLWGQGALSSVPIITFAFTMHTQLMPIWAELRRPTTARIRVLVSTALAICCSLYLLVGSLGYLTFFDLTEKNLLLNYSADTMIEVGKFAYVLIIIWSFPLMMLPARLALDSMVAVWLGPDPANGANDNDNDDDDDDDLATVVDRFEPVPSVGWRRIIEVTLLVFFCYFVAIFMPDIHFVFGVVGATSGVLVVYIVPGAVLLRLRHKTRTLSLVHTMVPFFLIVAGIFFSIGGLYSIINEKIN